MEKRYKQVTPHVAIRVAGSFLNTNRINIVEEHNNIQQKEGSVFFGKAGKTFDANRFNLLKIAIKDSCPVLFILIQRVNNEIESYSTILKNIYRREFNPNLNLIPKYYRDTSSDITTWFEIGYLEQMGKEVLSEFSLFANGRPLLETICLCRTSLMLVKSEKIQSDKNE